jgi:hypothetical protein
MKVITERGLGRIGLIKILKAPETDWCNYFDAVVSNGAWIGRNSAIEVMGSKVAAYWSAIENASQMAALRSDFIA